MYINGLKEIMTYQSILASAHNSAGIQHPWQPVLCITTLGNDIAMSSN